MNKAYYKEFACIKLALKVFILDFWENGRSKNESGRSFLLHIRSNDVLEHTGRHVNRK